MSFPIPDAALDDRFAIVGTAGSGKTYLALTAIERLLWRNARVVFCDALGVGWGLRLMPDGKIPSPFNIPIFGGSHADIPVNEHAGAVIGETVATMRESCIVDLSGIGTKAAERRFMLAFLTALYRHASKEPLHVIIDEADMWAPQRLLDKEGEAAKLLGMMETLVRRGRVLGFIPWLLTQRPAVLSKDVLSQADGLVALKLTSSQDRDAIGAWIEGQADRAEGKAMLASLPGMARGQGVLWIPGRGILGTVHFPEKTTYDSSRTPKRGEKRETRELKPLDLGALKEKLGKVEAEVKQNDPRALKAEVSRLTAELRKAQTSKPVEKINTAALEKAREAAYRTGWRDLQKIVIAEAEKELREMEGHFRARLTDLRNNMRAAEPGDEIPGSSSGRTAGFGLANGGSNPSPGTTPPKIIPPRKTNGSGHADLPRGEMAVLVAAAQFSGVEREQLTILTGYKRSSRDAYTQRLREKGLVGVNGSTVPLTPEGEAALPHDYEPLPTGAGLQEFWLNRLPEGERKILQCLIEAYPNAVPRSDLDDATGYKRSSRDAYLQRMKAKRLWQPDGSGIRASEALF